MGSRKRSKLNLQSKSQRSLESPGSKPNIESQADAIPSSHISTKAGDLTRSEADSSVGRHETTVCPNLAASWFGHT